MKENGLIRGVIDWMNSHHRNLTKILVTDMIGNDVDDDDDDDEFLFVTGTSPALIKHDTEKASPSPTTIHKDGSV